MHLDEINIVDIMRLNIGNVFGQFTIHAAGFGSFDKMFNDVRADDGLDFIFSSAIVGIDIRFLVSS